MVTEYDNMRLPKDAEAMRFYMKNAVLLELDENYEQIATLKFLRMKIKPKKVDQGPKIPFKILKLKFELRQYPTHWCYVFYRKRLDPDNPKIIVTDWVIEVRQHDEPHSWDCIIVRRIPCVLSKLEEYIQQTLHVVSNNRVIPATILHIYWEVKDLTLYS